DVLMGIRRANTPRSIRPREFHTISLYMRFIHLLRFLIIIVVIAISAGRASAQEMMQGEPQISPAPRATAAPPPPPSNREMQIPQQVPQQPWTPPPTPSPPAPPVSVPMVAA